MGDDAPPPPCLCPAQMPAARRVTRKAGPNQGRPFWVCAATDGKGCKFFAWAGAAPAPLSSAAALPSPPPAAARAAMLSGVGAGMLSIIQAITLARNLDPYNNRQQHQYSSA